MGSTSFRAWSSRLSGKTEDGDGDGDGGEPVDVNQEK